MAELLRKLLWVRTLNYVHYKIQVTYDIDDIKVDICILCQKCQIVHYSCCVEKFWYVWFYLVYLEVTLVYFFWINLAHVKNTYYTGVPATCALKHGKPCILLILVQIGKIPGFLFKNSKNLHWKTCFFYWHA